MTATLLLNSTYEPLARLTLKKLIKLLLKNKVEIIEEYEDRKIRMVSVEIKMPSIVRLLKYARGKRAVRFSRENIYARDAGKCQYCGHKVSRAEFTYEHVVPRHQGGKTCWENVVVSCMPCNQKKGGRTPAQAGMKLLSTPVKPKKLPDRVVMTFTWEKDMPTSWLKFLRSDEYWNGELEQT